MRDPIVDEVRKGVKTTHVSSILTWTPFAATFAKNKNHRAQK